MVEKIKKVYKNLSNLLLKLNSNVQIINEDRIKIVEQKFDKKWRQLEKQAETRKRLRSDLDTLKLIQDLEMLENM